VSGFLFEHDPEKATKNSLKHGISFGEAQTVFTDPLVLESTDSEHSVEEERLLLIGQSFRRRLLYVVFTQRGDAVRIISARKATKHERRLYEEGP
jgi:hypothetical protein